MFPTTFEQSNITFGPPPDMTESQVMSIPAYRGKTVGGSCDGAPLVIVAWQPDEREIEDIKNGKPIFLCCLGGLPPHCLGTHFDSLIHTR